MATLLFAPKLIALVMLARERRRRRSHGGALAVTANVLPEPVFRTDRGDRNAPTARSSRVSSLDEQRSGPHGSGASIVSRAPSTCFSCRARPQERRSCAGRSRV